MFSLYFLVAFLISSVSAHFQLQYPVPRGPFVEDNEPTFCDGYTDAVSNRTVFPLGNSFITLNSEHPVWTLGVLISLEQDPTNFTVFNHTSNGTALPLAKPFFQTTGEGVHCVPLDLSSLGISGLGDGSNVTIQIEFSGGDGNLFQCADLTLSSNATIPSDVQCTNVVGNTTTSSSSSSTTSPTASPSTTQSNGFLVSVNSVTVLLAVVAVSIFVF